MNPSKIGKHMLVHEVRMMGDCGVGRTSLARYSVCPASSYRYRTAIVAKNSTSDREFDDTALALQGPPNRPLLRRSERTGENVPAALKRLAQELAEHRT